MPIGKTAGSACAAALLGAIRDMAVFKEYSEPYGREVWGYGTKIAGHRRQRFGFSTEAGVADEVREEITPLYDGLERGTGDMNKYGVSRGRLIPATIFLVLMTFGLAPGQAQSGGPPPPPPPAPKETPPAPIDPGRLEGSRYVNDFFGVSLSVPEGWAVQDSSRRRAMVEKGRELAESSADERKRAAIEAGLTRVTVLVSAYKYPPNAPAPGFNANFTFLAERIPTAVVKTGADYFDLMLRTVQGSQMKMEPTGAGYTVKAGGREFYVRDVRVTYPWGVAAERFSVTLAKNYALVIGYVYMDQEDVKTFDELMRSVTFK